MTNKIKSETIYRIDHVPGDEIEFDPDFIEGKQSYHEYDEAGRLIVEIAFTRDGDIADKMEYNYDDEGKLLNTLIYGEDDEILERREMIWSADKKLRQEIIHYLDGSQDIHDFLYDDDGNLTRIEVKDDEDEAEFSEKYFYEGGKVVKTERWNANDELIFRQEDEYQDGNLISRTIYSEEDSEPFTLVQRFNSRGHREEELRYNSRKELVERNVYEENENGRVIRMVEENKQRKNTTEFSYDDKGNVIYQKETDLNGEINHELYRYFSPDGEPVKSTVEMVARPSMERRAYSLFYIREMFS
jgi:hypothetical protein